MASDTTQTRGARSPEITAELMATERLLWAGRPRQGVCLRFADLYLIPFSLVWGGFAIFWEFAALKALFGMNGPPDLATAIIFPLFGLPFVVVGLYLIFGRFLVDAKIRAKTYYGLTDERAFVVTGLFNRKVRSVDLRTATNLSLSERADGSGTIYFGPRHPFADWYANLQWPGVPEPETCFDLIDDAKSVYNQVREAQAGAK